MKVNKKIISILLVTLLACTLLFALTALTGCSSNAYKIKDKLDKLSFDMSNAQGLCITTKSQIEKQNSARSLQTVGSVKNTFENYVLAKVEEMKYQELTINDADDKILSQGGLGLEIYKMHVEKDFTYVAYISSKMRQKAKFTEVYKTPLKYAYVYNNKSHTTIYDIKYGAPTNFNLHDYENNDFVKSYMIDNTTGKIYSTKNMPTFNIENGVIKSFKYKDNDYYPLHNEFGDVGGNGNPYETYYYSHHVDEQGNMVVKDLCPNKSIIVYNAVKDKDGFYYVCNDTLDKTEGNVIYTTNKNLYMSEDRIVYILSNKNNDTPNSTIPLYKYQNGKIVDVEDNESCIGLKCIMLDDYNNIPLGDYPYYTKINGFCIKNTMENTYIDYKTGQCEGWNTWKDWGNNGWHANDTISHQDGSIVRFNQFDGSLENDGNYYYKWLNENVLMCNHESKGLYYAYIDWDTIQLEKKTISYNQQYYYLSLDWVRLGVNTSKIKYDYFVINNELTLTDYFVYDSLNSSTEYLITVNENSLPELTTMKSEVFGETLIIIQPLN